MARESNSSIMSVGEMIDTAFGEPDVNVVNHKLIQTILYILARQLRVLERRVEIEIGPGVQPSSSSLSVTEVKVHAMHKKKKRPIRGAASKTGRSAGAGMGRGGAGAGMGGGGAGRVGPAEETGQKIGGRASETAPSGQKSFGASVSDKTPSDKTSSNKTISTKTPSDKTSSDKTSSQKTTSDKTSSDKTTSDKTTTDKTTSDKTTSDKTTTEKSSSDKTSSDKTSDKTSTDKTSSDKTSTDKTSSKSTSDKTTTEKSTSEKTSTEKTSSGKTSSDKTTSDKTSTDKSSSDKTSSDKTSSGKTTSDKTSSDKTSSDKMSSDKTSSEKPSSDKTTSDKTSSDKTSSEKPSSSDKTSSDKTSSKDKISTEKSSSGKTTTETSSSARRGPGAYAKRLETVEMQRETELRVIHQRADSREEYDKTPSPMASMDSVEATYEKLLVVERIPADEARVIAARGRTGSRDKTPRLSVVTQDQFEKLAMTVRRLQQKFGPIGSPSFPENEQLMLELRKGASLTDAMAALQLSARLEATEKALEQMLSLVTDLASKTPGIDLTGGAGVKGGTAPEGDMEVIFGATATKKGLPSKSTSASRNSTAFQQPAKTRKEPTPTSSDSEESVQMSLPHSPVELDIGTLGGTDTAEDGEKKKPDRITYEELDNAMQELYDDIIKTVNNLTAKSTVNADNAYKMASKLEGRLDASLNLGTRMYDLETLVSEYAEQINILDTSLSSQMTNYQEELTQMQHDLETALETMAEVLANTGGDTTAVAELNAHFSNLQSDIDITMMRQKELKNTQNALAFDLESLRKQIEILRETKSDREEVADALRDKAGLGALNGLVSIQQFMAVRGDMEKRIGAAYDKFNSQETVWQKIIDDLLRELNDKADWIQLVSLKEEINKHLENLRYKLNAMMDIVGEPKAAAVAKKLHRDTMCLSCAAPADMELEEPGTVPALPALRPQTIGAESSKPKEDGDHVSGLCYPGYPIPHPRDPRSHVCQRWCGGSHTVIANTVSRAPAGMIITPALRQVSTAIGSDGKTYMVDETIKPCSQCIITQKATPEPSIAEPIQEQDDFGSGMTPSDFRQSLGSALPATAMEDVTPPPPQDED